MNSWARKFKRVIPVVLSILVLLSMAACASKEQESGHSREDNGSSLESSGQSETVIDTVTPVQYVYSSDTVTFTEYGDRVDVCDVAGNMPDILAMDSSVRIQSLISKGLLADVGELISKDAELSEVEFMENVFDALCGRNH